MSAVREKSFKLAICTIALYKYLCSNNRERDKEFVLSKVCGVRIANPYKPDGIFFYGIGYCGFAIHSQYTIMRIENPQQ